MEAGSRIAGMEGGSGTAEIEQPEQSGRNRAGKRLAFWCGLWNNKKDISDRD